MNTQETQPPASLAAAHGSARASAIVKDILDNHMPRVIEGLKVGYVDENQILVICDHAMRARILKEADLALLTWAVARWHDEVSQRPLVNEHRRTLDDTWRQVIRFAGGNPTELVGLSHDELLAQND
jgi:hypothetical protein